MTTMTNDNNVNDDVIWAAAQKVWSAEKALYEARLDRTSVEAAFERWSAAFAAFEALGGVKALTPVMLNRAED